MTNDEAIQFAAMTTHIWDIIINADCIDATGLSPVTVATDLIKLRRASTSLRGVFTKQVNGEIDAHEADNQSASIILRIKRLCKSLRLSVEIQGDPRGAPLILKTIEGQEFRL